MGSRGQNMAKVVSMHLFQISWSKMKCAHFTFTLFLGRDHHIQTMVRTITCQVPLVSDKAMSSRVATTVDKMAPLSNSGGQLLLRNSEIHSTMNSVQRPLVALSEAETQWTCSAFKGHASAISVNSSIRTLVLCLLLFSIMIR